MQDKKMPLTISVKETSKMTGLGMDFLYQCCRRQDELRLPNIRTGRTTKVVTAEIPAWIDRMSKA